MKHIELRYFKIKEHVERQKLRIEQAPTANQLANIFTKPLPQVQFVTCREKMLRSLNDLHANERNIYKR